MTGKDMSTFWYKKAKEMEAQRNSLHDQLVKVSAENERLKVALLNAASAVTVADLQKAITTARESET
jgi:hypothetical protein